MMAPFSYVATIFHLTHTFRQWRGQQINLLVCRTQYDAFRFYSWPSFTGFCHFIVHFILSVPTETALHPMAIQHPLTPSPTQKSFSFHNF